MCLILDQFLWGHSSRVCDISCFNIHGWAFIRGSIFFNLLEKSAFLASKLGNRPLLEHGPVIEILT